MKRPLTFQLSSIIALLCILGIPSQGWAKCGQHTESAAAPNQLTVAAQATASLPTDNGYAQTSSPRSADAWNDLGVDYSKAGQPEQAIMAYRQALSIDPTHAMVWYNLGVAYTSRGQMEQAIAAYREALRIDPENFQAGNNLGVAYTNRFQTDSDGEFFKGGPPEPEAVTTLVQFEGAAAEDGVVAQPVPVEFEEFTSDGEFFKAPVPKDWPKNESISEGRLLREFGVDLKGPRNKDGAYLRISIIYYADDHDRFTAEKYIRLNALEDAELKIKGEFYSPITSTVVANRRSWLFARHTFDFIPPYGAAPKKVPVYEYRVVVPGEKGGFYVLIYHAPEDLSDENLGIFKKVMAGFKPAR